jgi:hypothetical protein
MESHRVGYQVADYTFGEPIQSARSKYSVPAEKSKLPRLLEILGQVEKGSD